MEPRGAISAQRRHADALCIFRDIPEREAVECTRQAGVELLGLSMLSALHQHRTGFLMGLAAHTGDCREDVGKRPQKNFI
ncbi:MAG: hypothetical protein ACR5LF_03785 [Symbiopectobacterium sp.]